MLSTLLLVSLLALVWSQESTTRPSDDGSGIFQVIVRTNIIGRFKYEDVEVILSQNQQKSTDIFFTPFPRVDPASTECRENLFSDHVELVLSVELYTPKLRRAVNAYLKERFSTLCAENGTCDVSLLPMNAIRLIQKGLRTNKARQMYTVNDEWYSSTLLPQSIKFIIYAANDSVCEKLRSSIAERCHLSNFEIQYSLHSEKTVERQVEITTEQIRSTSMFNQIRSQFPKSNTIALTGEDFKQLINEVIDKITMKIRVQEGFDSQLQDPVGLDKLLERQLQLKQVQLEKSNDQLWDSLYWTNDLTRPDRLAKAINTIFRQNPTDVNSFLYDRQAAKNIDILGLNEYDIDRFKQLDKLVTTHAHSSSLSAGRTRHFGGQSGLNWGSFKIGGSGGPSSQSLSQQSKNSQHMFESTHNTKIDTNHLNVTNIESNNETQYVLSRADVEKYLSELFEHVHLEGEIVLPKPINAHLIKLSTLQAETKLCSHTILVRTRSNVHALPLQCSTNDNTTTQYRWLEDKVEHLTTSVERLTRRLSEIEEQASQHMAEVVQNCSNRVTASSDQQKELEKRIVTLEYKAAETITKNERSNEDSVSLPDILKWKLNLIIENDLRFDPSACGPGLFISDNNTQLRQNVATGQWRTCRTMATGWTQGVHYWSIRIIDRGPLGHVMIGIVPSTFDTGVLQYSGQTSDSYGFQLSTKHKFNNAQSTAFTTDSLKNGDVIGVLLDLDAQTLSYFNNGQILGTAFGRIPLQSTNIKYHPAVGFHELGQWVSLIKTTK